jgi:uncharacterized DUF497 family protein
MQFEWDPAKDRSHKTKHGLSFRDASELFSSDVDCLEIYDEAHSVEEDRFIPRWVPFGRVSLWWSIRSDRRMLFAS